MSESVLAAIRNANAKRGRHLPGREENFPRQVPRFGIVARALWPEKTAAELAFRANVSERTAKNWLSGEHPPSARALVAIMQELG